MKHTKSEMSQIMRLMAIALDDGTRGLSVIRSDIAIKVLAEVNASYETALSRSLPLSLSKSQCKTFDEKSHQVELLRVRLENLIKELDLRAAPVRANIQTAYHRRTPVIVDRFLKQCLQMNHVAREMKRINRTLMRW